MEELSESIIKFINQFGPNIILIIIFLIFSALFSGSETALYSIDRFRKHKLFSYKEKKYKYTQKLLSKPNELLVTILFGNMIVNVFLSTVIDNTMNEYNEIITIGISTFVILIFGEVLPKFVSINKSWNVALFVSKYIYYFFSLIKPVRIILSKISQMIANSFTKKGQNFNQYNLISEKDLKTVLKIATDDNIIPKDEAYLIENVFEFADMDVRNVMTPRINMFALPYNISIHKLLFEAKRNKYSKIPIYKNNYDNIIGLIYLRDLIPYFRMSKTEKEKINIKSLVKNTLIVHEKKPLKVLLQDFINQKIHIAVVIDEYGGTEGIVTLNDIIEQLLGRFIEEDDENIRMISKISNNKYIVLGECPISDFSRLTGIEIEDNDAETIAGYVLKKFDKIPTAGEKIEDEQCSFEIKNVNQNKIGQILVKINVKEVN